MKYLVTLALTFLFTGTPPAEEKTELCDDGICVVQFNAGFNADK